MSPRQRNVFFIALFFGLCAAFDRLLLSPANTKLKKIEEQIVQEESLVKSNLRILARKNQIIDESKSFDPYYTENIPTEQDIFAGFLKDMESFGSQAGIASLKISPAGQAHTEEYLKYQADIECSAKLEDLVKFMHSIDSSKQLIKVTKFNLNGKRADTEELKATISVSFMLINPSPQKMKSPATTASAAANVASAK